MESSPASVSGSKEGSSIGTSGARTRLGVGGRFKELPLRSSREGARSVCSALSASDVSPRTLGEGATLPSTYVGTNCIHPYVKVTKIVEISNSDSSFSAASKRNLATKSHITAFFEMNRYTSILLPLPEFRNCLPFFQSIETLSGKMWKVKLSKTKKSCSILSAFATKLPIFSMP